MKNKIILFGFLIVVLVSSVGCSSCDEITEQEATIKILEYRETHTRAECLVYCDNLDMCSNLGKTQYNENGCLRRC